MIRWSRPETRSASRSGNWLSRSRSLTKKKGTSETRKPVQEKPEEGKVLGG